MKRIIVLAIIAGIIYISLGESGRAAGRERFERLTATVLSVGVTVIPVATTSDVVREWIASSSPETSTFSRGVNVVRVMLGRVGTIFSGIFE